MPRSWKGAWPPQPKSAPTEASSRARISVAAPVSAPVLIWVREVPSSRARTSPHSPSRRIIVAGTVGFPRRRLPGKTETILTPVDSRPRIWALMTRHSPFSVLRLVRSGQSHSRRDWVMKARLFDSIASRIEKSARSSSREISSIYPPTRAFELHSAAILTMHSSGPPTSRAARRLKCGAGSKKLVIPARIASLVD